LKSKFNFTSTSASKSIKDYFDNYFFSSSDSRDIIFEKLGQIGCSILAASSIETTAKLHILSLGYVHHPIVDKYLSRIAQATKRVSLKYYFLM